MGGIPFSQYPKALDALKQAVKIDPDNVRVHFYLGVTYLYYFNDKSSALEEYKILKNLNNVYADKLFELIY